MTDRPYAVYTDRQLAWLWRTSERTLAILPPHLTWKHNRSLIERLWSIRHKCAQEAIQRMAEHAAV